MPEFDRSVIISGNLFQSCTAPAAVIFVDSCERLGNAVTRKDEKWKKCCVLEDNRFEDCDCADHVFGIESL